MVNVEIKQIMDVREMLIRLHMENVQKSLNEQRRINDLIHIIDSWLVDSTGDKNANNS